MLSQSLVKKLFEYADGKLYWHERASGTAPKGAEAGCVQGNGYRGITIRGRMYPAHRLIYLYHHGRLPAMIDHIDGDILNNRVENLRAATVRQNGANRKRGTNNSSGVKNVSWCKTARKWTVMVQKNKMQHYFGRYESLAEAADVARQARLKLLGEFTRHE